MISIIKIMERKTPLIKNNKSKKAFTLIELMASLAIVTILFGVIGTFIVTLVKLEDKSNTYLSNTPYIKSIMDLASVENNFKKIKELSNNEEIIYFDEINELQDKLLSNISNIEDLSKNYKAEIIIEAKDRVNELYLLKVKITNLKKKNNFIEKEMYIDYSRVNS
ncbi:prepilin-type N-terminal cleavage/methylation domain-containing protein [Clostridium sp. D53t1_180928_C8]|uniref:type II secretion system protein n=1 Tax=Clostridium sp. D53t1_180928_C8 TaxID=2787101 RepID=UPI0018A946DD|nr:prepilin-type N-terminal cleavage/methylation domain-containing protein [Clostridium sp. D53t1_180928_C8]